MILSWILIRIFCRGEKGKTIKNKKVNIGIGFITGRKNFLPVVRTYLYNWSHSDNVDTKKYALHLFVAYDLKFTNTEFSDYQITDEEVLGMVDSVHYLGRSAIANEARSLVEQKIISPREARLVFGDGYAGKRNAVMYFSLTNKMDTLIFFDDDEYPVANVLMNGRLAWEGQSVLAAHIETIFKADVTCGYHCGYISPIPNLVFNKKLTEEDFRTLIQTVSNDIISWDSVKEKMKAGGVTYADHNVITKGTVETVVSVNGMKPVSGANLGINLKNLANLFPFYNPPGARGEDTFLSTCICENKVLRIPVYAFHDGFSAYGGLLSGALPNALKTMKPDSAVITKRFLKALIGWIRYKPLLVYLTQRDQFEYLMDKIEKQLKAVIPKLCDFYNSQDFAVILEEFCSYRAHVEEHSREFEITKDAWVKIMNELEQRGRPLPERTSA